MNVKIDLSYLLEFPGPPNQAQTTASVIGCHRRPSGPTGLKIEMDVHTIVGDYILSSHHRSGSIAYPVQKVVRLSFSCHSCKPLRWA
jgi:hypothetical protein